MTIILTLLICLMLPLEVYLYLKVLKISNMCQIQIESKR